MKYIYFVRGEMHAAMAQVSIASLSKADPAAKPIVMTDDLWALEKASLRQVAEVRWIEGDRDRPMMLVNLDAQCAAIASLENGEAAVLLDTDTIVLQMMPLEVPDNLVVTWRDRIGTDAEGKPQVGIAQVMPYNYGVIGVRGGYKTLQAFMWMRERIRTMSPGLQQWYGNQVALAALCGPRPESGTVTDLRAIPWTLTSHGDLVAIRKVEGSRYNYTPQQVGERIHGMRSILHFKGKKRGLMKAYAERLSLPWFDILNPPQQAA